MNSGYNYILILSFYDQILRDQKEGFGEWLETILTTSSITLKKLRVKWMPKDFETKSNYYGKLQK